MTSTDTPRLRCPASVKRIIRSGQRMQPWTVIVFRTCVSPVSHGDFTRVFCGGGKLESHNVYCRELHCRGLPACTISWREPQHVYAQLFLAITYLCLNSACIQARCLERIRRTKPWKYGDTKGLLDNRRISIPCKLLIYWKLL